MRFRRSVKYGLSAEGGDAVFENVGEVSSESHRQGTEICFITAGCEGSSRRSLPSHQFSNPADGFRLDSRGHLRAVHTRELRIECGDQSLREKGHVGRRGIHHSKIVRAGNVKAIVDELCADLAEDVVRVFPNLGKPTRVGVVNPFPGGRLNASISQGSEETVYYFNQLKTKLAARL